MLVSVVQQNESPYMYIYPLPFGLPSHSSHRSTLSRVPCAPQYVLVGYPYYACILSRFSHAQLFATLWTVVHSPGSSVHGILQARMLEWVTMPSSKDLPNPGIEPSCLRSPALADRFYTTSTSWEALKLLLW